MKARPGFILSTVGVLLFAASASAQVGKQAPVSGNKAIETFTGFAVNVTSGQSAVVEIVINRWSTDGERDLLKNVLKASGSEEAVRVMQDLPQVGYIKTAESGMGDALFYARETTMPDGSRSVVIATNRPISAASSLAPGAMNKYDATVIEMHFAKGKKGEGKIVVAGKASIDPATGKLKITNYAGEPTTFENITSKTP